MCGLHLANYTCSFVRVRSHSEVLSKAWACVSMAEASTPTEILLFWEGPMVSVGTRVCSGVGCKADRSLLEFLG